VLMDTNVWRCQSRLKLFFRVAPDVSVSPSILNCIKFSDVGNPDAKPITARHNFPSIRLRGGFGKGSKAFHQHPEARNGCLDSRLRFEFH
jgi:hypothetical protein